MYNRGWVVTGLALFIGLFIFSSLYGVATGAVNARPKLALPDPAKATQSIEDTTWMRENHVQLLVDWREDVVRNNDRVYVSRLSGKQFEKSLTNTCLNCHENRQEFCDSCHAYTGVAPNCWDCHDVPKERRK